MKYKFFLLIILLIACITRIPMLSSYPNGFTGDEAQQGYDAYSILKTGKDEWGVFLPISPRGFGDYKPPLYTYLSIPAIGLFGLSIESVRLTAAIIGVLTVLAIYYLASLLFQNEKVGLFSAFLLAISPWHIQLSRTAFEGGAGLLLFITGFIFFIKTGILNHLIKLNNKYLSATIIFWGLSMYTYHSFRLFIVFFLCIVFLIYRKQFSLTNKMVSGILILIFLLPIFLNFNSASVRFSDVGIFNTKSLQPFFEERSSSLFLPQFQKIVDNKYVYIVGVFLDNYLSYFNPTFYFTGGRSDFSYLNFPMYPLYYLVELIFILASVYFILVRRLKRFLVIFVWILLAPISASLTQGPMSVNRAGIILPALTLLSGFGFKILLDFAQTKFRLNKRLTGFVMITLLILSFLNFGYFYLIKLPIKPPENLRFGYEQVFKEALKRESQYDYIIFDKQAFTEPQIFVAFYDKLDPVVMQQSSKDWLRYEKSDKDYVDQLESYNLGKFLFEGVNWQDRDKNRHNILTIASADRFPEDVVSEFDIKDSKGKIIYRAVSNNKNEK